MTNHAPFWFLSTITWIVGIGVIWVYAWILNPQFTSGTIWFLAFIFSGINSSLAEIIFRLKNAR